MQVQSRFESSAVSIVLPAIESLSEPPRAQRPTKAKQPIGETKFPLTTLGQKRPLEWLSTGLPDLDTLLGGGIPKGRIIECFGGESSGKTTFGVQCLAQAQLAGGVGALIEPENSLAPDYACRLGVATDDVLFGQPENGNEAILLLGDTNLNGI